MKVLDWETMKNGAQQVLGKQYVLYGASSGGAKMIAWLKDMMLIELLIAVFDSNSQKWDEEWNGYRINPPEKLKEMSDEICILIASDFITDIFEYLTQIEAPQKYALSGLCFRLAVHFDVMNDNAAQYLDEKFIDEYKEKYDCAKKILQKWEISHTCAAQVEIQTAITRFPNCILLAGMTKTGNSTLDSSFEKMFNAVSTRHFTYYGEENSLENLQYIIKKFPNHKIRVITGIREPIERLISAMWQEIPAPYVFQDKCFANVISNANTAGFIDGSFKERAIDAEEWLHHQIEEAFGVDVFGSPFDAEKGYIILSNRNVSVFIYRLDFLNSLEKEIGEFAQIQDFKLIRKNIADNKEYAFAYHDYLKEVQITKAFLDEVLEGEIMQHFYTETEREKYRTKWSKKICN